MLPDICGLRIKCYTFSGLLWFMYVYGCMRSSCLACNGSRPVTVAIESYRDIEQIKKNWPWWKSIFFFYLQTFAHKYVDVGSMSGGYQGGIKSRFNMRHDEWPRGRQVRCLSHRASDSFAKLCCRSRQWRIENLTVSRRDCDTDADFRILAHGEDWCLILHKRVLL